MSNYNYRKGYNRSRPRRKTEQGSPYLFNGRLVLSASQTAKFMNYVNNTGVQQWYDISRDSYVAQKWGEEVFFEFFKANNFFE